MSVTIKQLIAATAKRDTRTGKTSVEHQYRISGTLDETEALEAVEAEAPTAFYNALRGEVSVASNGRKQWIGTVPYETPEKQTGTKDFQFDTTGSTVHITTSLATRASYARDGFSPPNNKQLIGVTAEKDIQGVDINFPAFKFQLTKYIAIEDLTQTYVGVIKNTTAKVNSSEYVIEVLPGVSFTFAAGEVLFMGATGVERKEQEDMAITFNFVQADNESDLNIGDILVSSKRGHDYLWVFCDSTKVGDSMPPRPLYAYVEQVYSERSFSDLDV